MKELTEKYREIENEIKELSRYVHDHPEMGMEEHFSSAAHVRLLEKHGFKVEMPYMGMETAFKAVFDTGIPGRNVSYLSEYDALPEIGHGCGHNILGAVTTGAGILLAKLMKKGRVTVFGTPAEETVGGKVSLSDNGAFDDVDAAICTHPENEWYRSGYSLAMDSMEFVFRGKSAHAATEPENGINALDAMLLFFTSVNALRSTFIKNDTVTGIITEGGTAPNVIPERCTCRFHIRASDKKRLDVLREKVILCAESAASAIGCSISYEKYENTYLDLKTSPALSSVYEKICEDNGIIQKDYEGNPGSVDIGNVSHKTASINPNFKITGKEHVTLHTEEFRDMTLTDGAIENASLEIRMLAELGYRVLEDEDLGLELDRENMILKKDDSISS